MKKLLLLSAIAFSAITINAQTVAVTVEGQPVANGATVESSRLHTETISQTMPPIGTIETFKFLLDPEVCATSSEPAQYTIKVTNTTATVLDGMPGLQICWPTQCVGVPYYGSFTTVAGELNTTPCELKIDSTNGAIYTPSGIMQDILWPDQPFTISCLVEIVKVGSSSPAFSFNLNMNYDPNALNAVDEIYTDGENPASYYDISGRRILNPQKGQLVIERRGAKATKVIL